VASGGGHWIELVRLRSAFEGCETVYVCVEDPRPEEIGASRVHVVNDATRWNRFALARLTLRLLAILWKEWPDVVVSTGAAPGCICVCVGKWMGARTVWIDSIANAEQLSLSGRLVGRFCELWLTQWPELARPGGPRFLGTVF
jgi:hypothetical protein